MDFFDPPGTSPNVANRSGNQPEPFMKRHFRPLLVGSAIVAASILTISRKGPSGQVEVGAGGQSQAAQNDDKKPYNLTALRVFNNTLMRVNDSYVDPTRVDPKQMLLAALDQVQKSVAEVLVEPHAEQNSVTVRVDTQQQDFKIGEVDSPWALSMKMRDIFGFISAHLPPGTDSETVRNIEYAACNGMLSTLDPHSTLLDPQSYNEMKLNTRGSFGGLGIVIGIRKGALTVIKPMPGTPAWNAGIRAGDRIVRIEKESTVNMMLNDAVSRLRGDPETKVDLWVEKAAEKPGSPKRLTLQRAQISVRTVEAHQLKNNVGYVKLFNSFAGNTNDELKKALDDLKAKGAKGIVLDLRSNPGGLLDQAIKVTDEFVDTGTIVTTVGYANKQREEKRANPGNQPHVPMAVLVNHGSASASEIVAGALKNLDRAVVIGTKTFGKGSVQVLYDNDDGSALKLTIAQYLTPGDVSIQSVGITPDILLDRVAVDKDKGVYLFRDYKGPSEAELEAHLISKNTRAAEKPLETFKYLIDAPPKKVAKNPLRDDDKKDDPAEEPEDDEIDDSDEFKEDFEIRFARDLLAQAKGWKRREVLASSHGFFDKVKTEEQGRITAELKKVGVDWTATGAGPAPTLVAQVTTDRDKNTLDAGETLKLTATVTNKGSTPASQVRAQINSEDYLFDGREFVFGLIKPGESKSYTIPVKIAKAETARVSTIQLEVFEEHGAKVEQRPERVSIDVRPMARPVFAYSYQLIDDIKGNGDGLVQRGESIRMRLSVKNIGKGKSFETLAQLRNLSDDGVFINKGRFNVNNLAPGQSKSVDFTFDVTPEYKSDQFKVEVSVYDADVHEYVSEKLTFPIKAPTTVDTATGVLVIDSPRASVYAGTDKTSSVIGTLAKGDLVKLTGKSAEWSRVELEAGRPGFVAVTDGKPGKGDPIAKGYSAAWQVSPPVLTLNASAQQIDAPTLKLSGLAKDDNKIADVYVFVSNRKGKIDRRKVFYRSNRKGANPAEMAFDADIPLWPGPNLITVVARESTQVQSQTSIYVERTGKNTVAQVK